MIGDNQTGHLKETKTIFSLFSSFTFTLFIFFYGGLVSFVSLLDKCFNIASASYPQWTKQVNQDRSKSFNSFVVVDLLPNLDASLYFFLVDWCPNMDLCLSLCFISVESNRTLFNCLLNLLGENQNGNWYQGWTKVIRKEEKKTISMNRFGGNLKLARMICGTFLPLKQWFADIAQFG